MTYISRKTRVIVPRWLGDCDAENKLRASRKRSDARLKRYSSCEDLRAWVNNNCLKHDHIVDLMSEREFLGKSKVSLYGRFIPVPVLVELLQNTKKVDDGSKEYEGLTTGTGEKTKDLQSANRQSNDFQNSVVSSSVGGYEPSQTNEEDCQDSVQDSNFVKLECEKYMLEKNLFEGMTLLCKAVRKLEKIDRIVIERNAEVENMRNQEMEAKYSRVRRTASSSQMSDISTSALMKNQETTERYARLLRKISCLREKLKEIQDYKHECDKLIRMHQKRAKCSSSPQLTELYNRERGNINRLKKQLEKLKGESRKLSGEMSKALLSLNNLKKFSRSNIENAQNEYCEGFDSDMESQFDKIQGVCDCGCPCMNAYDTSEDENQYCSDYATSEDDWNEPCDDARQKRNSVNREDSTLTFVQNDSTLENRDSENANKRESMQAYDEEERYRNVNGQKRDSVSKSNLKKTQKSQKTKKERSTSKSKLKFVCPKADCKKTLSYENLAAFENLSGQKQFIYYSFEMDNAQKRPSTSPPGTRPSIKSEKSLSLSQNNSCQCGQSKEVKSETTMMEIEKALRDYEQRLKMMDCLEYKVKKLKDELSEGDQMKREWKQQKEEKEAEKEKSKKDVAKLCAENFQLRKQVRKMVELFESQWKKGKEKDLECEVEELRKKLAECQGRFQNQGKYISELESALFMQKREIENLTACIQQMRAVKESTTATDDRRYVQRSRSYSPEAKNKKMLKPKVQGGRYGYPSWGSDQVRDEDQDIRRGNQLHCYPPQQVRRMGW